MSDEHRPGCCGPTDGSVADELECDGQCWCHQTHETEFPTFDPRAAGALYPTDRGDGLYHHGCCGCPNCRGGFAGRQIPDPVEPPVEGLRKQQYYMGAMQTSPLGTTIAQVCEGCGCVVGDLDQHDEWHRKTRSIV
jgi:hypothetical protein